jgi:T5SS/PEP-CTERM-associated repeat protein
LVADGATAIINGTSTNITGNLTIGTNGDFTQLVIINGGAVTNVSSGSGSSGYIGLNPGADNNQVIVTGANSIWKSVQDMFIGYSGSFNSIVISNGGRVIDNIGTIGRSGNSNSVLVTGTSSLWTNVDNLELGNGGSFNQLIITNGGRVGCRVETDIGVGGNSNLILVTGFSSITGVGSSFMGNSNFRMGFGGGSFNRFIVTNEATAANYFASIGAGFVGSISSNNVAIITDPGSSWTLSSSLSVGSIGAFNQLIITNGAQVQSASGYLGSSAGSSNNVVQVTGANSLWANVLNLYIGTTGSINSLIVSNQGSVTASNLFVGYDLSSSNNTLRLAGGVIYVTGFYGTHVTDVSGGTLALDDGIFNTDNLILTNGTRGQFAFNGGTLVVGGGTVSNSLPLIVGGGLVPATLDVHVGQPFVVYERLIIGSNTANNRLYLTNGGPFIGGALRALSSSSTVLGYTSLASNNQAVLNGPKALWTNAASLVVGLDGSANQLLLTNGATLLAANLYLGLGSSSSNNIVTVAGGNLFVTNATADAVTDLRDGALTLVSGLFRADRLLLTNSSRSVLHLSSGTLQTGGTTVSSGSVFAPGIGGPVLELVGNGIHQFADGLFLPGGAVLKGNGMLIGNVTNAGTLSPGASIGQLVISGDLVLTPGSINLFELNKTLGTNDNIIGLSSVTYGGTLQLTNLSGTLTAGDSFKLFNATSYSNSFTSIVPAIPGAGLKWNTANLTLDGTLGVASNPTPTISQIALANGTNITISATGGTPFAAVDLLSATNITLALSNWLVVGTAAFNGSGEVTVTNSISPEEPQRFYRFKVE